MEKDQAHHSEIARRKEFQLTPIVYGILRRDREILLLKRKSSGSYSLPAGHLEEGEQFVEALTREVSEEIGIVVNPQDVTFAHLGHFKDRIGQRVGFFFEINNWEGVPQVMEPENHEEVMWCSVDDLPWNTVSFVKTAINDMNQGKQYSELGWKKTTAPSKES